MATFIAIEKLRHHPSNPRKDFGDLSELADSIKQQGLICPLLVVPSDYDTYVETGVADEFFVIAGNRRLEACKLAGVENVYCEVAKVDDETAIGLMLTENIIRQNLNTAEEAQGFQLMLNMGKDEDTIAKETGFNKETVKLRTKLRKLNPENLQAACEKGASLFDLAAVADIDDEKEREKILKKAGTRDFNNAIASYKQKAEQNERAISYEQFMRDHEFEEFNVADHDPKTCFATLKAIDADGNVVAERGYMTCENSYFYYQDHAPKEEDIDPNRKYCFVKRSYCIDLYRDVTEEEAAQRQTENADLAERRERQKELNAKINDIENRHKQLRENFILEFNNFKKKQKELKTFAVAALNKFIYAGCGTYGLEDKLNKLMDKCSASDQTPDRWLLLRSYVVLEGGSFIISKWNSEKQEYEPHYNQSDNLTTLYTLLTALGYEASEEEEQISLGTHPIYVKEPEPEPEEDGDVEVA